MPVPPYRLRLPDDKLSLLTEEEPPLGVLGTIGRVLDYPRRKLTQAITGKELSGRQVLQRMGLLKPNLPGLDAGDVAGFLTEVATDPLTYLGGLGALTRAGKTAAQVGKISRAAKAAEAAARLAKPAERASKLAEAQELLARAESLRRGLAASGAAPELAAGASAQAALRVPQRAALSLSVPFTGLEVPLVRAPGLLGAGEKALGALGQTRPIQGLRRLFDTKFGKSPELEPYVEQLLRRPERAATMRAGALQRELEGMVEEAVKQTGRPREEILKLVLSGREALGIPKRLGRQIARLMAKGGAESPEVQDLLLKAKEAKAAIQGVPKAARPLVRRGTDLVKEMLGEEIRTGARSMTNVLRAGTKAYAERVLSQEAKEWLRTNGKWGQFDDFVRRAVTTRTGSQIQRQDALLEEFTTAVNEFFSQQADRPAGNWFEESITRSLPQRQRASDLSVASAKLIHAVADDFARNLQPGDIPLGKFLAQGPLHRYRGVTIGWHPEAIERTLGTAGMAGKGIPRQIADEVFGTLERLDGPDEVMGILKAYDQASGYLRFLYTIPNPAYHIRNLFSNTIASWLDRAADPRQIIPALRLMKNPQEVARLKELGVITGQDAKWILSEMGVFRPGGLGAKFPGVTQKVEKGSQAVESFSRVWHYLSKKAQGATDVEAASSVKKYLFDYSELTPFEQTVARRALLFYQWPKKMTALLMKEFFDNPKRMQILVRGTAQPTAERQGPLPEFIRGTQAIPIGENAQGDPRFLFGLGSPLEALNRFDFSSPEGGAGGLVRGALRRGATELNPFLRVPAEIASGREFYFDRPIMQGDKAEPIIGSIPGLREAVGYRERELPGGGVRQEGDPMALYALRGSPFQRLLRTFGEGVDLVSEAVGGDFDPREKRLSPLGIAETFGGVKVAALDEEDIQRAMISEIQRNLVPLQRTGAVGEFPTFFAKGEKAERDPQAVMLLQRMREAQKGLKKARERNPGAP